MESLHGQGSMSIQKIQALESGGSVINGRCVCMNEDEGGLVCRGIVHKQDH